jgi:hypothetical protein
MENEKAERVIRLDDFTVVSIGTGAKLEVSRVAKLNRAGKLGWLKDAIGISMTGNTQAIHYNLAEIFSTQERAPKIKRYFRFQTMISPAEAKMDDPSKINLIKNRARRNILGNSEEYKTFKREHIEPPEAIVSLSNIEKQRAQEIEKFLASQQSAHCAESKDD